MLSRILGNHSQILGLRELHYFGDLCDPTAAGQLDIRALDHLAAMIFSRQARDVWGTDPTELELSRAKQLCESLAPEQRTGYGVFAAALACLAADAGKRIVCEQTPRNVFYAQSILEHLPKRIVRPRRPRSARRAGFAEESLEVAHARREARSGVLR